MKLLFEELDYRETPMGGISLRRRADPRLEGLIIYEVRLDEEFLMSSLFTDAEVQLARLGLARLDGGDWDVVVGGLGLGYTAAAALREERVRSLQVVEVMEAVVHWHRDHLVPLGEELTSDSRCSLVQDDFFRLAGSGTDGFFPGEPDRRAHAVLLDIDHAPDHWLAPAHADFYTGPGLRRLRDKLHPGGIFGLWSNDPPDEAFRRLLGSVFADTETHVIRFDTPYTGGEAANTVYLARRDGDQPAL